ncbi:MAG: proton-conducting transporter membrane subunit [Clostridiaceae bacterium]|nr:proton-conducting transporter membrane subunit [Clostridiaceae bacterium]
MTFLYWIPLLLPLLAGCAVGFCKPLSGRRTAPAITIVATALSLAASAEIAVAEPGRCEIVSMTETLTLAMRADTLSSLFAILTGSSWLLVLIYAFCYMEKDAQAPRFFAWLMFSYAALSGLYYAENLVTMYMFFELVTLLSMPLVLQDRTKESIAVAVKYLLYSLSGAFMGLFGVFVLYSCAGNPVFTAGGVALDTTGREGLLLAASFLVLVGFGVKAGLFPLHGWLPAAHPVAPAPASALLSGVIVKAGVFATLRWIYYTIGADVLRGTWVQTAYLVLTMITIFMGSMMAYREDGFKRRLAYSTVSQVSYALLGIGLLHPVALAGALLHVVYHSVTKNTLFLTAGSVIHSTGKKNVTELRGVGQQLPVTMWCFTIASVTLIGIPPMSAFYSKWYLAEGALSSGAGAAVWIAPVELLLSALLTAGYLLPVAVKAFFPGHNFKTEKRMHEDLRMVIPMLILTSGAAVFGVWSGPIGKAVWRIAGAVLS